MPMSAERPTTGPRLTPYQLTLSALIVPWRLHMLLNGATGIAFALIAGPYLALLWVAALSGYDMLLQREYRRLDARSAHISSDRGLRRLAWLGFTKSAVWISAPTAFAVMAHSPQGLAFVAVTTILLTSLAVSTFRNSRLICLSIACLPVAAVAVCVVAVFGAGAGAGLLVAIAIVVAMLVMIASGTNRTVTSWNRASEQTAEALANMRVALARSEAVERSLRIAVEIADLYVFEANYERRSFAGAGSEQELFGQLLGGDFWEDPFGAVLPADLARVQAAWEDHFAGKGPYKVEHRAVGPDGREIWVSVSAEVVREEDGRPRALIGAIQNITERKRGELVLAEALHKAEAGSRAKSEFLSIMSHETRTPLNGVLGMVQAMGSDELAPAQRVRLDVVRKSAESLLSLLNSVLDLARTESGEFEFEDGTIDIAAVADAAVKGFEAAAAEKGLRLGLDVSPSASGVYTGDAARVGQVLHHLLSNAVKFTDHGSVSVTVDRQGESLMIHVADTGVGIAAELKQRLFENFVQADASLTRRHGGSGLGLAICRQLTARMGGTLDVQSSFGRGSTFTVTLPLPKLGDAGDSSSKATREACSADQRPLRVLVAEDNPVNQLVLVTLLRQVGIEPTIVSDGWQAVVAWRSDDWDLILMDIQMPVMDGVIASQTIRDEEGESGRMRTPILAVTANVMHQQVLAYRQAGIDGVVAKPVQVACLIDAIEGALATQPPSMEPSAVSGGA